jgi:hypothetical protein
LPPIGWIILNLIFMYQLTVKKGSFSVLRQQLAAFVPDRLRYHRRFRLVDVEGPLVLTDHLQIHVLELPNFELALADLREPLDFWLYFLKNGKELDADELPEPLNRVELQRAMEVLKMFSQDRMERELYEGRLRAKRDALTQEMALRVAMEQVAESERQRIEVQQRLDTATMQRDAATMQRDAAAMQRDAAATQRDEAATQRDEAVRQASKSALAGQIQLCERLLGRDGTDSADLQQRDEETLRATADRLERELARLR